MPHQWIEGNLPVSSKCSVCDKTCGSVLRLQDWRCLWCRAFVHTACRPQHPVKCPLGLAKVSVVPPTALNSIGKVKFYFKVLRSSIDLFPHFDCTPLVLLKGLNLREKHNAWKLLHSPFFFH